MATGGWDGELPERGEVFALTTVAWRCGLSSSRKGRRAVITASGQVFGFSGGASCTEPVVVREARHILADLREKVETGYDLVVDW